MELKTKFNFGGNELTQEEKGYIEEKIEKLKKLLPSGEDKEVLAEVNIKKDKKSFWTIEFLLDSSYEVYRASESDRDLRNAMDRIEESVKIQLKKDKEKITDLRIKGKRELKEEFVLDDQARI